MSSKRARIPRGVSSSSDSDSSDDDLPKRRGRANPAAVTPCATTHSTHTTIMWHSRGTKPRPFTYSVAVCAAEFAAMPCLQMQTLYAYNLARACLASCVNQIVVYPATTASGEAVSDAHVRLARLLQYLETPPALRKLLLPHQNDYRFVGMLPPLGAPHHAIVTVGDFQFVEGVVIDRPVSAPKGSAACRVQIGPGECLLTLPMAIPPRSRLTLKLRRAAATATGATPTRISRAAAECVHGGADGAVAEPVAPSAPAAAGGPHWGYTVLVAGSFADAVRTPYGPDAAPIDLLVATTFTDTSALTITADGAAYRPLSGTLGASPASVGGAKKSSRRIKRAAATDAAAAAAVPAAEAAAPAAPVPLPAFLAPPTVPLRARPGFKHVLLLLPPSSSSAAAAAATTASAASAGAAAEAVLAGWGVPATEAAAAVRTRLPGYVRALADGAAGDAGRPEPLRLGAGAAGVVVAAALGTPVHAAITLKTMVPPESLPLDVLVTAATFEAERKLGAPLRS